MKFRAVFVAGAVALAGCGTNGAPKLSLFGSGDGGNRPAARGGAVASTIISAMKGGLIGPAGAKLDDSDRRSALEAEYRALEYTAAGQAVKWAGSGGIGGEVVAAQPYRVGSQDCRQYSHAFQVNGPRQTARGTACRNADGSWTPLT